MINPKQDNNTSYFQLTFVLEVLMMKRIKLNNGIEMPIVGFGVYQIDEKQCQQGYWMQLMLVIV